MFEVNDFSDVTEVALGAVLDPGSSSDEDEVPLGCEVKFAHVEDPTLDEEEPVPGAGMLDPLDAVVVHETAVVDTDSLPSTAEVTAEYVVWIVELGPVDGVALPEGMVNVLLLLSAVPFVALANSDEGLIPPDEATLDELS